MVQRSLLLYTFLVRLYVFWNYLAFFCFDLFHTPFPDLIFLLMTGSIFTWLHMRSELQCGFALWEQKSHLGFQGRCSCHCRLLSQPALPPPGTGRAHSRSITYKTVGSLVMVLLSPRLEFVAIYEGLHRLPVLCICCLSPKQTATPSSPFVH